MECIILAGGLGTRLRPITYHIPKPIIPLVNTPMIMHIIDSLPEEVDRVILPVNYRKEMLDDYFTEHQDSIRQEVVLVEEKKPLGTGGAIRNCEREISGSFIVFNGDVLNSLKPRDIIDYHISKGGIGALAVWKVIDPTRFGIIGFDEDNRISRFLEKPEPEEVFSNFINAGTYVLEPDIFDHIDTGRKVSIEREVYPFVLEKELYAYPFTGYWVDAGTREDFLLAASRIMNFKKLGNEVDAGTVIHPDAKILSPVVIGKDCRIGNCIIGPGAVIGQNCLVEKNARVTNSTILDHVTVGKNVVIRNSIIGNNMDVKEKKVVENSIVDRPLKNSD